MIFPPRTVTSVWYSLLYTRPFRSSPYDSRSLQRTFNKYVGVSPKWVIRRYRLQEAAEALACGHAESMRDLALRLGYFDQAHFIRDFKAVVGKTPHAYAREDGRGAS